MWREWIPIAAFSDWMSGTTGMPVKRDHVCYSTHPLGWNLGRTTDNAYVIKGISLCLCWRHHDHSDVEAVRDAVHTYQRTAGPSFNLTKSNPYHWADEHCLWGQSHEHYLRISSEKFGHQNPCDYREDDPCTWYSIVTRIRNAMYAARLRDLNLFQRVRYVNTLRTGDANLRF